MHPDSKDPNNLSFEPHNMRCIQTSQKLFSIIYKTIFRYNIIKCIDLLCIRSYTSNRRETVETEGNAKHSLASLVHLQKRFLYTQHNIECISCYLFMICTFINFHTYLFYHISI